MKFIQLNSDILEVLEPYREWFFSQDLKSMPITKAGKHDKESCATIEYLQEIMAKPMGKNSETRKDFHEGPPEVVRNVHFGPGSGCSEEHKQRSAQINKDLVSFLGARFSAVHVYYPHDGFMGWHNNWDCPGYNILINYNSGDGWFKYWDTNSKTIQTMEDPMGWSAKVGYYGGPENPFYHCAGGGPRITFGFVIPDKNMWEMMIEDIT
ncbi:MAG: hypothetical protein CBB97_11715 [Candidatus Endolissoclinum sp. TMED37]|nr:MAG: hypothetical protein CBB97_11715 [Candidatus Endolissoclinum sp. TMED37]